MWQRSSFCLLVLALNALMLSERAFGNETSDVCEPAFLNCVVVADCHSEVFYSVMIYDYQWCLMMIQVKLTGFTEIQSNVSYLFPVSVGQVEEET